MLSHDVLTKVKTYLEIQRKCFVGKLFAFFVVMGKLPIKQFYNK